MRSVLIYFTSLLGPETYTQETYQVKLAVFVTTFMNSGLLIILMTANSNVPILKEIFKGEYADFTSNWFDSVGTLIVTNLLINSFYPLIELVIGYIKLTCMKMVD